MPTAIQEWLVQEDASRAPEQQGKGITSYLLSNENLAAEILWALKVVLSHYSYKNCEEIAKLFQRMFRDSTIAQKFTYGEKKCAYLACFGLAPLLHQHLLNEVKKGETFVLLFDESHTKVTWTKQMDLLVRFQDQKFSNEVLHLPVCGTCNCQ